MNVSEARWMAYVDGELDAEGAARVEEAMRQDPALAAKVAAQQRLRHELRTAWAPVLEEPVPDRLRAALRAPPPSGRAPVWLAAAASLLLGVVATTWWQATRAPEPVQFADGKLAARGDLADALDHRLSADPARGGIGVGLSFRSRDGVYCRSFALDRQSLAGLACRRGDGWQVVALGSRATHAQGLRQASSPLPPAVLAEVDARLLDEPLDADGERRAREAGWR